MDAQMYKEAHERLNKLAMNGVSDYSVCHNICGGKCCSFKNETEVETEPWTIEVSTYDEAEYYKDPENISTDVDTIVCLRKDKKSCDNKPIICKIYPFFPKKLHLELDKCDFSVIRTDYFKSCKSMNVSQEYLKGLSEFFTWLYSDLQNRMSAVKLIVSEQENVEEAADVMMRGVEYEGALVYFDNKTGKIE